MNDIYYKRTIDISVKLNPTLGAKLEETAICSVTLCGKTTLREMRKKFWGNDSMVVKYGKKLYYYGGITAVQLPFIYNGPSPVKPNRRKKTESPLTFDTLVKEWYAANYPYDYQLDRLDPDTKFRDVVLRCMGADIALEDAVLARGKKSLDSAVLDRIYLAIRKLVGADTKED